MAQKFNKVNKRSSKRNFRSKGKPSNGKDNNSTKVDKLDERNDASWYTGDSALTFDAGRFNWFVPNGSIIDVVPGYKSTFPGVVALTTYAGIGVSYDENSVVNIAARKMYTWIRRSKSSYATYDPADLMQYCIAIAHAYQYYNFMTRIYGLLNVYSQLNRYIPDALISANGIDPNSLRGEMSDFLFYINKYGSQLSSLAAPATLPYFRRQAWMYSNVYTDDQSGKSTLYEFVPNGFYTYNDTSASLVWNGWTVNTANADLDFIISMGDAILTGLLQSQDFWNISADILNAYGDNILSISAVPVDYTVLPVFDLEVLSQIQNTILIGTLSVAQHVNDITQNANGALIYAPKIAVGNQYYQNRPSVTSNAMYYGKRIVNMYKDNVTPEDVFVATRLTPTISLVGGSLNVISSGTELIGWINIWNYAVGSGDTRTLQCTSTARCLYGGNYSTEQVRADLIHHYDVISLLSNVSYHPHIISYFTENNGSGTEVYSIGREIGDVANFTVMDDDDLGKLHTSALFSLFHVPTLGGFNG